MGSVNPWHEIYIHWSIPGRFSIRDPPSPQFGFFQGQLYLVFVRWGVESFSHSPILASEQHWCSITNVFQNDRKAPMKSDIRVLKWSCAPSLCTPHAPLPIFFFFFCHLEADVLCRLLQHPSWDCESCHLPPTPRLASWRELFPLSVLTPCHFIF